MYSVAHQVELLYAIQVFVVVSLVCQALLFPFVCCFLQTFFFLKIVWEKTTTLALTCKQMKLSPSSAQDVSIFPLEFFCETFLSAMLVCTLFALNLVILEG